MGRETIVGKAGAPNLRSLCYIPAARRRACDAREAAQSPREELEPGAETFISLIGHELRTPLTVMLGALKMLEFRVEDPVDRRLVSTSRKSAEHLAKLVESILTFSNATTGELQLDERQADLGYLIAEVVEMNVMGSDGEQKYLVLGENRLPQSVYMDPTQIRLALTALALNAVYHGGSNMAVGAGIDEQGNIQITVTDDGTVGTHVDLAQLYKPFVVGKDIDRRGTRGGLGLGLPLTRKLVELHGGEFEIRSRPGKTVAAIRLPRWRLARKQASCAVQLQQTG